MEVADREGRERARGAVELMAERVEEPGQ